MSATCSDCKPLYEYFPDRDDPPLGGTERITLCARHAAVEALEKALRHAIYRTHQDAAGCDGCRGIEKALAGARQTKEQG